MKRRDREKPENGKSSPSEIVERWPRSEGTGILRLNKSDRARKRQKARDEEGRKVEVELQTKLARLLSLPRGLETAAAAAAVC